jgi:hypothetical protein
MLTKTRKMFPPQKTKTDRPGSLFSVFVFVFLSVFFNMCLCFLHAFLHAVLRAFLRGFFWRGSFLRSFFCILFFFSCICVHFARVCVHLCWRVFSRVYSRVCLAVPFLCFLYVFFCAFFVLFCAFFVLFFLIKNPKCTQFQFYFCSIFFFFFFYHSFQTTATPPILPLPISNRYHSHRTDLLFRTPPLPPNHCHSPSHCLQPRRCRHLDPPPGRAFRRDPARAAHPRCAAGPPGRDGRAGQGRWGRRVHGRPGGLWAGVRCRYSDAVGHCAHFEWRMAVIRQLFERVWLWFERVWSC